VVSQMNKFQELKQLCANVIDKNRNKKGEITLGSLPSIAIGLVIVAAVFVGGFLALDALSSDLAPNSFAANATTAVTEGMYNVTSFLPTTGTMIGIGLFLGVILLAFAVGRDKGYF